MGISVSGGGHGLARPGGVVLADVQHPECRFLRRRLGRGHNRYGPGNLQHVSGIAVHRPEFTQTLKDTGDAPSMGGKGRWITSSSSGCGARQNGSESTRRDSKPAGRHARRSETGFISTTSSDCVRLLTVIAPWTYTGKGTRPPRRHTQQPGLSFNFAANLSNQPRPLHPRRRRTHGTQKKGFDIVDRKERHR